MTEAVASNRAPGRTAANPMSGQAGSSGAADPVEANRLPEPAIVLSDLVAAYSDGPDVLHGLNATVQAGGITGVMGPDAAGKTTLMRSLAGLLPPKSGKILVFGTPPTALAASGSNVIAYMPQRFGLYEDITVEANLHLYASLAGVAGARRDALFKKLLQFTSLGPFTRRLAGRLSGGMKQKLGIACALLGQPRLLLLDEPGVGVDPQSRREIWKMVQDLSSGGMTVIWSTSYMDEAARCPHLIMLDSGKVLFNGKPEDMASRMKGNVFLLAGPPGASGLEHRKALADWTGKPGIIDALIQGNFLRLCLGKDAPEATRAEITKLGGKACQPDIEDAYMAATGGMDKRSSPYAAIKTGRPAPGPVIVANQLTRKFGAFTASSHITFTVAAGHVFGLLGPNGAGKSTTFRMLCGLLKPSSGQCSVAGVNMLTAGSQARGHIGYMAQKFSLYPEIKVRANIEIFADLYDVSKQSRKTLLPELVASLDLEPFLETQTTSLPLGLKQRLALLCATLHQPDALFLDEPTSGVDARARRDFWKHISALTEAGVAVLVTTHFMEEAEYCDEIGLIYRGTMIQKGSPDDLKALVKNKINPTMEDAFISCIEDYEREHPV